MSEKQIEIAANAAESSSITDAMELKSLFTRREMLGMASMAGIAGVTGLGGLVPNAVAQTPKKKPRIACLVSYWGLPTSHADWIVNKLIDGYWWKGAATPSQVEVVSVYINQFDTSLLGQKVCKAKNIPIFKTVGEAVTLGGKELAVDGVVVVCEHGNYPKDLQGRWLLPRWWIYQQVMQVFEQSKRSVPVFNDKHLAYSWNEAKWMFDKSRELGFPLSGGSSIPVYYRTPEIDLAPGTPLKNSIVIGNAGDEGAIFHLIDLLQSFHDRRKGGETGVKSVQSIRGPEAWKWVERTPWANNLLEAVRKNVNLPPGHSQQGRRSNLCIVEYRDGTNGAIIPGDGGGYSYTYAGEIEGQKKPTIVSMPGFPGPISQYHASSAYVHWIIEMMLTGKEPFNAERLLLSTGITNHYMDSNWQNGKYSAVGRVVETPFMDMKYHSTHGPLFNTGPRPPNTPYFRGFSTV